MKFTCPHCQGSLEIETNRKFLTCPFCGLVLQEHEKPSFHETWAQMLAEPFLKSSQPISLSKALPVLEEYEKAFAEGNIDCVVSALSFYTKVIQSQEDQQSSKDNQEMISLLSQTTSYSCQAINWLLIQAEKFPMLFKVILSFFPLVQSSQREAALVKLYERINKDEELVSDTFAYFNQQDSSERSVKKWMEQLGIEEESNFSIEQKEWFSFITRIEMNKKNRLHQIQSVLEKEEIDILFLINLLLRPSGEDREAFDHVQEGLHLALPVIEKHQEEYFKIIEGLIENNIAHRGINMVMSAMISMDESWKEQCDKIHESNFIKLYMQPYEYAAQTDWKIKKGFMSSL